MAIKRMLIDASHPEETRVVVVDGNKVEDYDVEVASRRQLKGNIYLAKVTRVEPSLQAAFVDYGGNRHGFLAFNEIHPDYYQIPVADRERLLAEQAAIENVDRDDDGTSADDEEELERRRARLARYYKIQEVVKRRQIMLVQVAKEERGNKGAALTTYLSLAGRYCVLMPNTARGGGISRKIVGATDRKRLKKILTELEVPEGMAVIVRTAGAGRSKAEIKRDYEYLMRLWSNIRETTLESTAPALVYEEASLIKRSIRDLYGRDIEEIIVQGEHEYRIAKEFMKLFISSHAKRVKLYEEAEKPLFQQFAVEDQLASMHQPTVQLRSGGYIVINPTEALVAIDVNSGRSTRERNIEETALRTNLEAADEIARQLRLRDMAGLVVLDFIDMENPRNQGMVERRLKEAMKNDRARVQLGRISPFGLLELSRQRLRPSLIETSFEVCPACAGMGLRRTTESTVLAILRKLEEEGVRHRSSELSVAVPPAVAMYLLNQKRRSLLAIEDRYQMAVGIVTDETLVPPDHRIERLRGIEARVEEEALPAEVEEEVEAEEGGETPAAEREEGAKRGRRRRSRRRRREEDLQLPLAATGEGGDEERERDETDEAGEDVEDAEAGGEAEEAAAAAEADDGAERPARKRRRRGKRGGRRRARPGTETGLEATAEMAQAGASDADGAPSADEPFLEPGEEADYDEDYAAVAGEAFPGEDFEAGDGAVEEVAVEHMVIEEVGGAVADLPDAEFAEATEVAEADVEPVDTGEEPAEFAGAQAAGVEAAGAAADAEAPDTGGDEVREAAAEGVGEEQPAPARRRRTTRRRRKAAEDEAPVGNEDGMVAAEAAPATESEPMTGAWPAVEVVESAEAVEVAAVSAEGVPDGMPVTAAADAPWTGFAEANTGSVGSPVAWEPGAPQGWYAPAGGDLAEAPQEAAVAAPAEERPRSETSHHDVSGGYISVVQEDHPGESQEHPAEEPVRELRPSARSEPDAAEEAAPHEQTEADRVRAEEEAARARAEEAERAEEARRTDVVRVGEQASQSGEEEPRRGWWQKLVT